MQPIWITSRESQKTVTTPLRPIGQSSPSPELVKCTFSTSLCQFDPYFIDGHKTTKKLLRIPFKQHCEVVL